MKNGFVFLGFVFSFLTSAFPQGNLIPPGAPAPTMKTLDQLEARTPISSAPFTIKASGSYYLTTNLTVETGDAITISADGVTLDLNGFTISSSASSATGTAIVLSDTRKDIAISNGHIVSGVINSGGTYSGSGFGYGIYSPSVGISSNVRVSSVSVSGCLYHGILINLSSTVVESCTVHTVGGAGIVAASISDSTALDCGSYGLYAINASNCYGNSAGTAGIYATTASNCVGENTGSGYGLFAANNGTANNCFGYGSNGPGLSATIATNCWGFGFGNSSSATGISATTANNCYGYSDSSQGINAETASNCYGSSANNRGIFVRVANSCSGQSFGGSYGLFATSIATSCYGQSDSGTGLAAVIAIGCAGVNSSGTSVAYTYHYLMPP